MPSRRSPASPGTRSSLGLRLHSLSQHSSLQVFITAGLDYGMLALVKAGMMDKMTNKRVNKWLNIAVRWSVRSQYYCTILHQTVTSSFVFRTRLRHRLPTLMACVVSKMHAAEVAEGISSIQPSQPPPHHLNLTRDTRTTVPYS